LKYFSPYTSSLTEKRAIVTSVQRASKSLLSFYFRLKQLKQCLHEGSGTS